MKNNPMMNTIRRIRYITMLVILIVAAGCNTKTTDDGYANGNDNTAFGNDEAAVGDVGMVAANEAFIAEMVEANFAEIALAKLAKEKSSRKEVTEIAEMLERDHTKALQELQALANQKEYSIPEGPDEASQQDLQSLQGETGESFERKWCDLMVRNHQKSIDNLEDHREKSSDREVLAWIDKTLPTLRTHLEHVKVCEENTELKNN